MKSLHSPKRGLIIESIIIVAIAVGMIFLNIYTQNLFTKLHAAGQSAVFVKDDIEFDDEKEFTEQLTEYLPSTYKMIELYDNQFDLLFQIQFDDKFKRTDDIKGYPSLIKTITNNTNGQAKFLINDDEQNVYFEWIINSRGEKRLLIVYSSMESVEGIWIFNLVSYMIIVLVFALLLTMKIKEYNTKIRAYRMMIDREEQNLR